jgi:hypothetical protein
MLNNNPKFEVSSQTMIKQKNQLVLQVKNLSALMILKKLYKVLLRKKNKIYLIYSLMINRQIKVMELVFKIYYHLVIQQTKKIAIK